MIITIGGLPASGKSVVAERLSERLGMKHYSAGGIMRKLALEKGITLDRLKSLRWKSRKIDKEVDEYQAKLGREEDNFIIDGRTSFHFIPNSFKVFFTVRLKVAAERLLKDKGRKGESRYKTVEGAMEGIRKRMEDDRKIYKEYYGIDCTDASNYDAVIDTSDLAIGEVVDEVVKALQRKWPSEIFRNGYK